MNTTRALGIAIAVLSVWAGAASQFSTLFGQHVSDIIVTLSTLTVATLGAVLGVISNQTNQIASVRAMPGVEAIMVNSKASPDLAKLAVDPAIDKVHALPSAKAVIEETAKAS